MCFFFFFASTEFYKIKLVQFRCFRHWNCFLSSVLLYQRHQWTWIETQYFQVLMLFSCKNHQTFFVVSVPWSIIFVWYLLHNYRGTFFCIMVKALIIILYIVLNFMPSCHVTAISKLEIIYQGAKCLPSNTL